MFIKRRKLQLKMKLTLAERLAFPTEEPPRSAADVPSFRPYFGYALLYAVVLENSSNLKTRKLYCSKLKDYISIKVSEVWFWCAAGFLILGIEKLLCQYFNLRIQKVLWKEALQSLALFSCPATTALQRSALPKLGYSLLLSVRCRW